LAGGVDAELIGLHWGSSGGVETFSPISNINTDMGVILKFCYNTSC
jgi:hypothetical protein